MSTSTRFFPAVMLCGLLTGTALAQSSYDKVLYLDPPLATSCLAVEIPTPSGTALTGLRWWHNDAQVAFPRLVLLEGEPGVAPDLDNAALILLEIVGASLSWGEVDFGGPVTSSTGTAYAVFYYPEGTTTEGLGAGPGIGIRTAENAAPFYLTGDAEHWVQFDRDFAIGIEPVYSQGKAEPRVLAQMKGEIVQTPDVQAPLVYRTELLAPRPNPFNPRVEIDFTLEKAGTVEIAVFDVRGREIATLLTDERAAGPHSVLWGGRDARGREVASGSYFARLTAKGLVLQQRLLLVR